MEQFFQWMCNYPVCNVQIWPDILGTFLNLKKEDEVIGVREFDLNKSFSRD